jgi:hypothetical protein
MISQVFGALIFADMLKIYEILMAAINCGESASSLSPSVFLLSQEITVCTIGANFTLTLENQRRLAGAV